MRTPVNFQNPYTSADLLNHLAQSGTSLCVCAIVTAQYGGTVIAVTSNNQDITNVPGYPGVTFKGTTGVTPSKVEHADGVHTPNMETDLLLSAAGITAADVLAGKWAHAAVTIFVMNFLALNMGQLIIEKGFLAQFIQAGQMLRTEARGINEATTAQVVRLTRPECDAMFGDARCGLNLSALGYIKTGTVTTGASQTAFTDSARTESTPTADYFTNGTVQFTSGNNNGFTFEVDSYNETTKVFTLRRPTPYLITNGDTYTATRGCRKNRDTDCSGKFSNVLNFRGFPDIPGNEKVQRLPLN